MDSMDSIGVIIVDENEFLRAGIGSVLNAESDIETVGSFGSAKEAIAKVNQLGPKVALVSLSLPDAAGFDACRSLLINAPAVRVVMLVPKLSNAAVSDAIAAGAAGILPNSFSVSDLVTTVRANCNGAMYLIPPVAELCLESFRHTNNNPSLSRLTDREKQILAYVPVGLSNIEIGAKLGISHHTVRNYISRILVKLNYSKRTELAAYAGIIRILNANDGDSK